MAKVEPGPMYEGGTRCWNWTGARNSKGYGFVYRNGQRLMAHQAAYMEWVGPIPEGMTLDHLCRNTSCCNPLHLEAVTMRENLLRGNGWSGRNARKTHCPAGHEYAPENTYVRLGQRHCRTCHREREYARRYGHLDSGDVAADLALIEDRG